MQKMTAQLLLSSLAIRLLIAFVSMLGLQAGLATAQTLPYQTTWEGMPFVDSFVHVKQLVITSYDGEKAYKKKLDPIVETLEFDVLGQNTEEKYVSNWETRRTCWSYRPDGCSDLVDCENASKQLDGGYTCHDGVIDSMMSELLVTNKTMQDGRCLKAKRYIQALETGEWVLEDSIQFTYDAENRLIETRASSFRIETKYLPGSIVMTQSNGDQWVRREITTGKHGLPITLRIFTPDNKQKKDVLVLHADFEYDFR